MNRTLLSVMCIFVIIFNYSYVECNEVIMELLGANLVIDNKQPYFLDDKDHIRFKYPCISKTKDPKYFMTLKINEDSNKRNINVFEIFRSKNFFQIHDLKFSYPSDKKDNGVNAFPSLNRLISVGSGMLFLEADNDEQNYKIFKINTINSTFSKKTLYSGKILPRFYRNNHYGTFGNILEIAHEKGLLIKNNQPMLSLYQGNMISFDRHGKKLLVNYYDKKNNANILQKINTFGNKIKDIAANPDISEFYPRFSGDGRYIAYIQNRKKSGRSTWDLKVIQSDNPGNSIATIKDIYVYDIEELAFFYDNYFYWVDNNLYFKKKSKDQLCVFSYAPKDNSYTKYRLKTKYYQINPSDRRQEMTIEIKELILFQVALINGKHYIIAECVLQTSGTKLQKSGSRKELEPTVITRIAVFKEGE
ncbi:hypothetical protein GMMP15_1400010 [Candidatus Magnetomoraceae bacterium gMMP-15]